LYTFSFKRSHYGVTNRRRCDRQNRLPAVPVKPVGRFFDAGFAILFREGNAKQVKLRQASAEIKTNLLSKKVPAPADARSMSKKLPLRRKSFIGGFHDGR
jgi:hypothetical protein